MACNSHVKNNHVITTLLFMIHHNMLHRCRRGKSYKELLKSRLFSAKTRIQKVDTFWRSITIHHKVRRQGTIPVFYFISSCQVLLLHTFQNLTNMVSSIFQVCYTYLEINEIFIQRNNNNIWQQTCKMNSTTASITSKQEYKLLIGKAYKYEFWQSQYITQ
jgi:hypothetical protein